MPEFFMTVKKRAIVFISLSIIAAGLYRAAQFYSAPLIYFVVEQSLIQKAPEGTNVLLLKDRFRRHILAMSDKKLQMNGLLRISASLEKAQHLTISQLDELLDEKKVGD
jgi:hypothetical protein